MNRKFFIFFNLLALISSASWAQESVSVSFNEALLLGESIPQVEAVQAALAARQRNDAAIGGTLQPSQLTLMPGAARDVEGKFGPEWQLNWVQGLNLGNLGGARRDAASAERKVLGAQVRSEKWKARLEAARLWLELYTLEQLDAVLDEEQLSALAAVKATQKSQLAGVGTLTEVAEAKARAAELAQQKIAIEGLRFEAAAHLALAMGKPLLRAEVHAPLVTKGEPPESLIPSLPELQKKVPVIEQLPSVAVFRLAQTATDARRIEAAAQYAPTLQVGAQFEQTKDRDLIGYGVLMFQFPSWGNSAREVSQARSEVASAGSQLEHARQHALTEFLLAVHDVEHSAQVVESLEKDALPALQTLREHRQRALSAGEGTVFWVFEARRRETQMRVDLQKAKGEWRWARARMLLYLTEMEAAEERP